VDPLSLIGNTPLVELKHCSPKPGVRLFAKLEGQNPTGSIKDRVVAHLIAQAQKRGELRPGQEIIEATTGNTGVALAMLGRRLGHPVRVVVPQNVLSDVARVLRTYGAEVAWVAGELGIEGALEHARRAAEQGGAFLLNQFGSADNPSCHYETTGLEILAACPQVDVLVCGLGTGGTMTGTGRRLREANPTVQLVAAEAHPGDQLQGLRSLDSGFRPPILDLSLLDGKILVRSSAAFRAVREVLSREGLLVGPSSGAVMHAALKWAQRLDRGNVVLIFADSGWKYLHSPVFNSSFSEGTDAAADEETMDDVLWW
jgi:cysteine synthase B